MSLTGTGRGGGKNLTYGVGREVHRSPRRLYSVRMLPPYCVESLARAHGGQSVPCPECRKPTTVQPEGGLSIPVTFYNSEDDLELERTGPSVAMCSTHNLEPLVFFCVQCDYAICIRCKLTKHDHHETSDLSEAAVRCQGRLERSKKRLQSTVSYLTKRSAEAHDNITAAKQKRIAIKQEVQARHGELATKMDKWRDKVLAEVDQANDAMDKRLATDAQKMQQELDSLLQLRQRVHHALGDASDAEKISVEREMREGQGSEEQLNKVKECVPATTVRPGLHYDPSFISEEDIRHFLGSPFQLSIPCAAASEVIVPIYRCGQDGASREVHSLCHVNKNQILISYEGTLPDYKDEKHITITEKGDRVGTQITDLEVGNSCRVTFLKYREERSFFLRYTQINTYNTLFPKGGILFRTEEINNTRCTVQKCTIASENPLKIEYSRLFDVNSGKPLAFDATKDGRLFVIVGEKNAEQTHKTERIVLLFHRDHSDPFTTYKPSDTGFQPADVCFWQENGQTKLLVADQQNDCVNIVNIEDDRCRFERYLAAGNRHLVRPTALDIDGQGNVWIGCGNGWILKCEKLPDCDESSAKNDDESDDECDGSAAVSNSGLLMVENSSQSTDVQSQESQ